jgi:hypothetical protein
MSKTLLRHTLKTNIFDSFVDFLIFIHFPYMKIHRLLSSLLQVIFIPRFSELNTETFQLLFHSPQDQTAFPFSTLTFQYSGPVAFFCFENIDTCVLLLSHFSLLILSSGWTLEFKHFVDLLQSARLLSFYSDRLLVTPIYCNFKFFNRNILILNGFIVLTVQFNSAFWMVIPLFSPVSSHYC